MVFNFNHPLLLLLIPVIALFMYFTSKSLRKLVKWRRRTILVLRALVFLLIVLCLAGFGIKKTSDKITTVFLVDSSDSMEGSKTQSEEFIKEALKSKKRYDKVAVVNFGENSMVEFTPSEDINFSSLQTKINSTFTNMEQALTYAASLIPSEDRKRIVLITDGRQNAGDALKSAKMLNSQGITLDIFPIANAHHDDVQIKEIRVPDTLRLQEKFEISVKLQSNIKTKARLKLLRDREVTAEEVIEVQVGENNFVFSDTAHKGGMVTYSVEIEPDTDTVSQNNKMSAFSYVEDIARILVIQDETEGASELSRMLEGEAVLTVGRPENLPIDLGELQKYDGYIISNVSAERFDDRFLDNLEISIKHSGKGLLVTGGDNSYAPGGYYKTALEKVLPVNMDVKSKEEDPNLGLLLVIDKSGSMSSGQYGVSKIELAKEAAIRSTEVLKKDDMIGVIGFDGAVQWVVPTQKLDNLKEIQDAIGTIRADGGTQILGPLMEAYESLKNVDTKLKHIILLTDGQAERTGYEPLIEKMNNAGITLSTVAVGEGADLLLLKALADGGKGRFYATDEFTDIPKIFAKETFLAGKKYLNNRTFTPKLSSYSPILNEITAIPQLDGYVSTVSKNTARVIFSSDENDPVLAVWQYGLGRTAAWTSDAKGMWTNKWMAWDQSPRFWKNLVSWLLQKKVKDDYSVRGEIISGKGVFELKLPPDEIQNNEKLEAVIVGPSGKEEKTVLEPVSPGVYKGNFSGDETGVYLANVSIVNNEDTIKTISSGFVIPFSPEYDIMKQSGEDFLRQLASESGGRIIQNAAEVFSGKLAPSLSINDMTGFMLLLLIFLLLLDIAVRRLNIPFEKLDEIFIRAGDIGGEINGRLLKPAISRLANKRAKAGEIDDAKDNRKYSSKKGTEKKEEDSKEKNKSAAVIGSGSQEAESHISRILEKKRKRGL